MANIVEAKKTKPYSNVTYTTGDPVFSVREFNKRILGNDNGNPSTEEAKAQRAAEKAAKDIGTISAPSPDGASSVELGTGMGSSGGEAAGGDCGGGMMEDLQLNEAKRLVRRYYMKPQNIFCANKTEVLNALIDNEDQDCTIYTLNNLGDIKDVTKLTNNDVIYYYEDGILYDKNRVRVMDYDLAIKHEENRPKIDVASSSDATLSKVYKDRLTGMGDDDIEEAFNLNFDDVNAYGEKLTEGKEQTFTCCICGEETIGYGNNPAPYKKSGKCCDACNLKFVIPARIEQLDTEEN